MIDTVTLSFQENPTEKQLRSWVAHHMKFPNKPTIEEYFQTTSLNNVWIRLTYYPQNPKYIKPNLLVQLSIPKLLFGNNVEMVTDYSQIKEAISMFNDHIAHLKWMPEIDLAMGRLYRVDAAYNHAVGEYVPDYLQALFQLSYPGRQTINHKDKGVYFRSGGKYQTVSAKFYDKFKESHEPQAEGILRQESTIIKTYYVERSMKMESPTLSDIRLPYLLSLLNKDLNNLHLNDTTIYNQSDSYRTLIDVYGFKTGNALYGYLMARQHLGIERINELAISERTIQRYSKMIAEAGVALATNGIGDPLPALNIDYECFLAPNLK